MAKIKAGHYGDQRDRQRAASHRAGSIGGLMNQGGDRSHANENDLPALANQGRAITYKQAARGLRSLMEQ